MSTLETRIKELRETPSKGNAAAVAVELTRTDTEEAVKAIEALYNEDLIAVGYLENELFPRLRDSWTDLDAAYAATGVLSLEAMLQVTDGEMSFDALCSLIESWVDPRGLPPVKNEAIAAAIAAATNVRSDELGLRGDDWDSEDITPLMIKAAREAYESAKT